MGSRLDWALPGAVKAHTLCELQRTVKQCSSLQAWPLRSPTPASGTGNPGSRGKGRGIITKSGSTGLSGPFVPLADSGGSRRTTSCL